MTFAAADRRLLADQLAAAGPGAPTLCAGWDAVDLARHLVVREAPLPAALGAALPVPALRRRAAESRRAADSSSFEDLVATFRSGPRPGSLFRAPGLDALANTAEHFVHLEDLRRAGEEPAAPRRLPRAHQQVLWRTAVLMAVAVYRSAPVGVVLASSLGPRRTVRRAPGGGGTLVVVAGEPGEILLHTGGREPVARVDVTGPKEAVRRFDEVTRAM